jgi:hypothetical protein
MEKGYAREEIKRLRVQLTDLRSKLADLESKVSLSIFLTLICLIINSEQSSST